MRKLISLFPILFLYAISTQAGEIQETLDKSGQPSPSVINIELNASSDGWDDQGSVDQGSADETDTDENDLQWPAQSLESDDIDDNADTATDQEVSSTTDLAQYSDGLQPVSAVARLPGEEVHYRVKLHSSNHHMIHGKASADIGKILFKSRLMPSNEVKLSMKLKQGELDDVELLAYFDLANFTMELDGASSVLNKEHKQLLNLTSLHLRSRFEEQYQDYDYPEHAFMLVQMLEYWSVSPEGFVHEKRAIVSQ